MEALEHSILLARSQSRTLVAHLDLPSPDADRHTPTSGVDDRVLDQRIARSPGVGRNTAPRDWVGVRPAYQHHTALVGGGAPAFHALVGDHRRVELPAGAPPVLRPREREQLVDHPGQSVDLAQALL